MQRIIVKKLLLTTSALALLLISTPAGAFNPVGSSRVPIQVPRDQNFRDPEYASVPIVRIENVYGNQVQMNNGYYTIKCGYEQQIVNPTDNRHFLTRFLYPKKQYVYENTHNCRKVYQGTPEHSPSYWVYYRMHGQLYKIQMQHKPQNAYIQVRVN